MVACPCCGAPVDTVPVEGLVHIYFPPVSRVIVEALVARYPTPVRRATMIEAIWGLDPNGGPDDPAGNIAVQIISKANPRLAPFGWRIAGPGRGRTGGDFRLVRLDAARAAA